jgi:membrane associated rhomboid family serine protease
MGVYDRDYYRNDPPGGVLGGVAPVCKWLIVINIAVFVLQTLTDDPHTRLGGVSEWLMLLRDRCIGHGEVWRLISYAFCHGDLLHLAGNMWFLWMMGSQIEPIYGQREFLHFYLTGALLAGVGFLGFEAVTGGGGYLLGASGAVMAVTMVCAMYYPSMKILFMFVIPIELRWLVPMYIVFDMYPVLVQLGGAHALDHVAHSAHLAGLAYGFLYKRYDWRYTRLLAGWSWPRFRRLVRTATTRKPDHVRIYEPPEAGVPTPDLKLRVDEILSKISAQGEASLTENEREILKEASRRYKNR